MSDTVGEARMSAGGCCGDECGPDDCEPGDCGPGDCGPVDCCGGGKA